MKFQWEEEGMDFQWLKRAWIFNGGREHEILLEDEGMEFYWRKRAWKFQRLS
jgi:hypothetical protein